MTVNPYFNKNNTTEQALYENLLIEAIQIYGNDLYYVPRTVINKDDLLGEDIASKFTESYKLEMYVENVEGYNGQDIFQKFGLEIRDEVTVAVARKRFEQVVTAGNANIVRPREGDLVYVPFSKSLFEITFVEHEVPFYQHGYLNVYKISMSLFEGNDELIDTGIPVEELDEEALKTITYIVEVDDATGFAVKDEITSNIGNGVTVSAVIVDIVNEFIYVANVSSSNSKFHTFIADKQLTNGTVTTTTVSVNPYVRPFGENPVIQDEADQIIDFSVDNPFGEP